MAARHLTRKRTVWLLAVFLLLNGGIAVRLFYVQVFNNDRYCDLAKMIRWRRVTVPAHRGIVYDRLGRELATNVPACAVYVQPRSIERTEDREQVAQVLSEVVHVDETQLGKVLSSGRRFYYVQRQLSCDVGEQVKEAKLLGVGVLPETRRIYPSGRLAAHVLGFTDLEGRGLEGIECSLNGLLAGRDGRICAEVDARGRMIPETRRELRRRVNGRDIILTIDAYLQHAAEVALARSFEALSAAGATAIVLDPHTGEILAIANCPQFDPNRPREASASGWRNRAITDVYEPGSTLKLVTVASALEEGMSPTSVVARCTTSGIQVGRKRIHCSLHQPYLAGHGGVNMFGIIKNSCNIGAATLALRLGPDKLYSYMKAFGLLDPPGSGMVGESVLGLEPPESWPSVKLANIGFGQGIAVSPLQMACAYAAIANGGKLMKPQIIREIRDENGKVVKAFDPIVVRRVVAEATANEAIRMMIRCVEEGTGKTARIEGYSVAGKTGSAQKASRTRRGFAHDKFVASFIGFVPAADPRLVICVVVDEPKGNHWGATCAAPVFKEIARQAMLYLRVPPDKLGEPEKAPSGDSLNVGKGRDRFGAGYMG